MSGDNVPFGESGPVAYNPGAPVSVARQTAEAQILSIAGVNGIGEGRDDSGKPAWIAYVDSRGIAAGLPASVDGRRVIAEVTGRIDAQIR